MISRPQSLPLALNRLRPRFSQLLVLVAMLMLAVAGTSHTSPTYAAASLKPGDFVISAGHSVQVLVLDRATGATSVMVAGERFDWPGLVATGPNGEVYVADNYYHVDAFTERPTIARLDPTTGTSTVIASGGFGFLSGLTTDLNGKLVVADEGGSQIVRVDPSSGARTMISLGGKLHTPVGVSIEADASILTTVEMSANTSSGPRQILRIRAGTNTQEVVSSGGLLMNPGFTAVGPDGSIYVADRSGFATPPRVIRVHPQSGAQAVVSEFPGGALGGILVDSTGAIFVAASLAEGRGGVLQIDPVSGASQNLNGIGDYYGHESIAMVKAPSGVSCSPRPRVSVTSSSLGGGRLQVNVQATGSGNIIQAITPGVAPNATLEAQPVVVGPDASFVVKRTGPGAVTFPFTVQDRCGDWSTFVGGGPNAF